MMKLAGIAALMLALMTPNRLVFAIDSPEIRTDLAQVIQTLGYNCGEAIFFAPYAEDADDPVLIRVQCGGDTFEPVVAFRVTFRPDNPIPMVEPW